MAMKTTAAATLLALATASGLAQAQDQATVKSEAVKTEIEALKEQLAVLQERLAQLEASVDRAAPAEATQRWAWQGDLRLRSDHVDQEASVSDRFRQRLRLRVGASALVNDDTRVEVQFTTSEGGDARSSNQTFTDANSRKALDLDTAYIEWAPSARWKITAGKMRYPWARTASFFFDGDVNPEGIAANWQQGKDGLFGSVFLTQLAERATAADSGMAGAQFGWRWQRADGTRALIAGSFYDHSAVRGYNPFQGASAGSSGLGSYGNSTTTSATICRQAVALGGACLLNDYDVVELLGEYQFTLDDRPLLLFANVARNTATTVPSGLDTAYALGFTYGRARSSTPGSWESGLIYQVVEKDALFAQWIDSDFAAGVTDSGGFALRGAYQFSKNWRVNVSYMLGETNRDVAATVALPTVRELFKRDHDRLLVDFSWAY